MNYYNKNDTEMDEGKDSAYNSAVYKMRRLDTIQAILNEINMNLLSWNELYQVYNYQLKVRKCDQLYQEVESKLNKDERKDSQALRLAIHEFMRLNKIHFSLRNEVQRRMKNVKVNESAWEVLEKWLFKYETLVRGLMDNHGMDTKYDDQTEGL